MGVHVKVGGVWQQIGVDAPASQITWAKISGGTVTEYTKPNGAVMEVHTFTSDGGLTVTEPGLVEMVIIAGGGGSGSTTGGAGGAGGVFNEVVEVEAGNLDVKIGAGGAGGASTTPGSPGSPSRVGPYYAVAGGRGGGNSDVSTAGGSSGGWVIGGSSADHSAIPGQGNTGTASGGGGGAGGPAVGGAGGPGVSIYGATYARGGNMSGGVATVNNTGNGADYSNRAGATGIVMVAVEKSGATATTIIASGGTEDVFVGDGNVGELGIQYKRHTFTSDGTFTVSNEGEVSLLLIGGGGGAGTGTNEMIGAGGAGGVLHRTAKFTPGDYNVLIGEGGAVGRSGGPTCVGDIVAAGGGQGANGRNQAGSAGGSGGGGGDVSGVGGKAVTSQGFAGGNGGGNPDAGGGGGAGGPGVGPIGGPGVTLFGTVYAKGGTVKTGSAADAVVANSGNGGGNNQTGSAVAGSSGIAFIYYRA